MRSTISLTTVFALIICCLFACGGDDYSDVPSSDMRGLRKDFLNPSDNTRPGCYWYWINDNISKEGITKDLEAMARVGIGRAYIGHIFNYADESSSTPLGGVKFNTDAWWEAVQWAVKEADRCGVEIGFFNSPGWSQSGGPWIKPNQSMRYLAHSETHIPGGQEINRLIPVPEIKTYPNAGGSRPVQTGPAFTEKDFQDVRLIAFKKSDSESNDIDMNSVLYNSDEIENLKNLFDNNPESITTLPGGRDVVIDFELNDIDASDGVQSIVLKSGNFGYVLSCEIHSSDNGREYKHVAYYSEQRGHQGPKKTDPVYIPFDEVKTNYVRVTFSLNRAIEVSELSLSKQALLGGYVRKQLGETSPSTNPPWDAYQWGEQEMPADGTAVISDDVIDLSDKMDSEGRLRWTAPEGNWVILRMGMVPIGTQNAPSSPESRGLEVDKMNKQHVNSLFDGMVGEFLRRTPENDRRALKYVIADSYETGPQNWTDGFLERFKARFGYSPERFLPVLSGRIVDNPDISDRFLWDIRRLIVEGISYDYVGGLREICNDNNLVLWLENYGHWGYPSEFLLYGSQTDQVGGEFWVGGVADNIECRAAVSGAHTYGKKSVYAEAFTSSHNFIQSPASLKKWCDWVFAVGINHLILHVNIHQPDERKPGIIQWFGTGFNRHNTWFEESTGFIDYIRRGAVMLKAGLPVADVAYYVGEDGPMMQGPMVPELPEGYNFDFINSDVLINRCSVENGKLLVKDGPSYSILVLPEQPRMRPEVALAIKDLVSQGASILGPAPVKSPSMQNFPDCDRIVTEVSREVWGNVDGEKIKKGVFGNGNVFNGLLLSEVFEILDIQEDIRVDSDQDIACGAAGSHQLGIGERGGLLFNHRKGKTADIYFLANTTEENFDFVVSLRCSGQKPSLWDAVRGEISDEIAFSQSDGRTSIPLHLDTSESVYIVLDKKTGHLEKGTLDSNTIKTETILKINTPWTVSFKGSGAPAETVFDELTDWTLHDNPDIRHFSGTAEYQTSFTLGEWDTNKKVILDLGQVAILARVFVNGEEAGLLWTGPWTTDISDFIKEGANELRIRVVNTWNNRGFADSKLPQKERRSYFSQPYNFTANGNKLHKSGLLGPVTVKMKNI